MNDQMWSTLKKVYSKNNHLRKTKRISDFKVSALNKEFP